MSVLLYRYRDAFAASQSVLIVSLLFLAAASLQTMSPKSIPESAVRPMQMSLVQAEPEPAPPLEPPAPLIQPPPAPLPVPVEPTVKQSLVRPDIQKAPVAEPVAPRDPVAPVAALPSPPVATPKAEPEPVPPKAVAPERSQSVEAAYVSRVREHLKNIKRYPTGREASLQRPTGVVEVWFVLDRNGALLDMGIETSSGSMLLDAAARSTVRRGEYPKFPDEVWSGKQQHRFTVQLDFYPAN